MNNELINKRDAISESESSLRFVLLTQMVKELDYLSPESRSLQSVNQLWDHTGICHPNSDLLIK